MVGATGSGKSTLCHLLAHLVDPWSGTVSVGGVDLRHVDPERACGARSRSCSRRRSSSPTRIRENVTLGDEALTDDDMARGHRRRPRAGASSRRCRHGYDTVDRRAGHHAVRRATAALALARALVRRPRLLLLDDATSAVDPRVEQQILDGLRRIAVDDDADRRPPRLHDRPRRLRPYTSVTGRWQPSGTHAELLGNRAGLRGARAGLRGRGRGDGR